MEEKTVTINIERYEELLDIEARVMLTKGMILRDRCINRTDILFILGFEGDAKRLENEEKERLHKLMEKENHNE